MKSALPVLLLAVIVVVFRLMGAMFPETLPNFQPLPALLLCAVFFMKGPRRWILPLAVWVVTDPFVSLLQGYPLIGWHHLGLFLGIGVTLLIARGLGAQPGAAKLLGGTAAAAVAFYLVSNCVSFLTLPLYPKTLEGFVQAQWTGPAGWGPTWAFLRNALASNLLFTALVLAGQRLPFAPAAVIPASVKKAAQRG